MASGLFTLKQVNQAISQSAWSGYIAPRWVEYLVVAGGGAGGINGGGGGGGGLLTGIVSVAAGASYTVTIGAGGVGNNYTVAPGAGVASVFGSISATGGGAGGGDSINAGNGTGSGGSGGSGGGGGYAGSYTVVAGQGVFGQGNSGGINDPTYETYGGGGGAGTVGINGATNVTAGQGGAGIASSISGTVTTYAGGGGGGAWSTSPGAGGVGGGGAGCVNQRTATSGVANTGGGGGGSAGAAGTGGSGGSGIVVVRYPGNVVFFTGGTVNYNNGYIIHIFTSNGTLAPTAPAPYNTSYQISRSLRFNKADNPNLSRTVGGSGNRRTFTFSAWIKRTATNTSNVETPAIFMATDQASGSAYLTFGRYGADIDSLSFAEQSGNSITTTSAVFRDLSAWYHIVLAVDTTQATSSNRVKIYVNGTLQDITAGSTYPPQNTDTYINYSPFPHKLGTYNSAGDGYQFNGYMAEVNFIDGQQLAATSFGATSTTTGVWAPIKYAGTYGTNGFYLNFSDNTNTTAATLGKDYSGNGNNWTPNNFSVTAGAGNDSLVDVPTQYGFDTGVGGQVRGNYCTLNPLSTAGALTTNGNLSVSSSSTTGNRISTFLLTSGKWYWEAQGEGYVGVIVGVGGEQFEPSLSSANSKALGYWFYGPVYWESGSSGPGEAYTSSDVIGVALDMDIGNVKFYKNNTLIHNLTFGSGGVPSFSGGVYPGYNIGGGTYSVDFNFGQRPFTYTAPAGFKVVCTTNLPTPTIGATSNTLASQFFGVSTFTGDGTNSQVISNSGFKPDWVWFKARSNTQGSSLVDSVRGTTKILTSNSTAAELTGSNPITFNSNGFTSTTDFSTSGYTYAAWQWRAGNNASASNSAGSIASTVSVNTTSGFSIVTFTGTSGNVSVGHGLGVTPKVMIVKSRAGGTWWYYTTQIDGSLDYLSLNTADGAGDASQSLPTSTVFYQNQTDTSVAYCFAEVAGYSKFGSYVGNGSENGPFVFTGFKPAFLMIKRTNASSNAWLMYDGTRNTSNLTNKKLAANLNDEENNGANLGGDSVGIDFLSNGFKSLTQTASNQNAYGATYIFMAFASTPFKYSLAR